MPKKKKGGGKAKARAKSTRVLTFPVLKKAAHLRDKKGNLPPLIERMISDNLPDSSAYNRARRKWRYGTSPYPNKTDAFLKNALKDKYLEPTKDRSAMKANKYLMGINRWTNILRLASDSTKTRVPASWFTDTPTHVPAKKVGKTKVKTKR